jgi:imidazolonepropionase-like amidohydrolase
MGNPRYRWPIAAVLLVASCGGPTKKPSKPEAPALDVAEPWADPETERPKGATPATAELAAALKNPDAPALVITGATVWTATGKAIANGTVILEGGAISYVGDAPPATPRGARVVDAKGKFVTPGIIDAHSHLGVYASPSARANQDGNEAVAPVTAHARARYGYWPQDPQIPRAIAGGVTSALILPGSANLVGGRGFIVEMRPGRTAAEVAFPGAPETVKMACGENPKRVYGEKGGPQTRMAEYAAFRTAFEAAAAYQAKQAAYARTRALWLAKKQRAAELDAAEPAGTPKIKPEAAPEPPPVDLSLETLAGVLRGDVLVQIHCYRASEMAELVAISDEYGFKIRSFHHALEAYKIRDILVAHDIAINTWADWWGFKLEAFDGIPENAGMMTASGGRATIHSDSAIGIQRLNQEAAKAMYAARDAGIAITDDQALRWITANPAWVLGIDSVTGTLEAGKRADVVVWSASPFSVYSRAELVIGGGEVRFDRAAGTAAGTDYELGNSAADRPVVTK